MLKALEKNGLVARQKVADDRRRNMLVLTTKGEDLFNIITPKSEEIYAKMEARHGREEIRKLVQAMAELQKNLAD